MKGKLWVILSTVAALHLVVGGLALSGGCESTESDPMPPGAYIADPSPDQMAASGNEVVVSEETVVTYPPASPSTGFVLAPVDNGNTVNFPGSDTHAAPQVAPELIKYKVQKGDSLWKIARSYGITVSELASYNKISSNKALHVGQVLQIPPGGRLVSHPVTSATTAKKPVSASKTTVSHTAEKASSKTFAPIPTDGVYVVQKGDSFYKIAAKYGVKASDLAAANNLTLDKSLMIGQKLTIPHPGASVTAAKDKKAPEKKTAVKTGSSAKTESSGNTQKNAPASSTESTDDLLKDIASPDEEITVSETVTETVVSPVANPNVVESVVGDIKPEATAPAAGSEFYNATAEEDTTLKAFAEKYSCKLDDLKKLNPQLPSDGTIKAGTVIKLPL